MESRLRNPAGFGQEPPWMGGASNLSTSSIDDVFLVRFVAFPFHPSETRKISDFLLNGPDPHLNEPDPKLNNYATVGRTVSGIIRRMLYFHIRREA